ncbi:hypothetical protein HYDPIDRAFT_33826 [Hydnomerulius pinastri MD-312]|uniref:Uncharacterized protein n=1 Tax=Hydnomerulius pinastri MD-312 TaxID=994086 RepID=A0A0C9VM99_9AGAM|nr:hypothetical protein HYDPIDRAFT_33826 [Hydnomerulius pinastri MD-312]
MEFLHWEHRERLLATLAQVNKLQPQIGGFRNLVSGRHRTRNLAFGCADYVKANPAHRRKAKASADDPDHELSDPASEAEACGANSTLVDGPDSNHQTLPQEFDPCHSDHPGAYTLPELRHAINLWQTDWGTEAEWDRGFHLSLCNAQEDGSRMTDLFFVGIESHASEGRRLLRALRQVVKAMGRGPRGRNEDLFLQVYDLVVVVMSEVKFFEVKLHEYAPSVPLSKLSDYRTYNVL